MTNSEDRNAADDLIKQIAARQVSEGLDPVQPSSRALNPRSAAEVVNEHEAARLAAHPSVVVPSDQQTAVSSVTGAMPTTKLYPSTTGTTTTVVKPEDQKTDSQRDADALIKQLAIHQGSQKDPTPTPALDAETGDGLLQEKMAMMAAAQRAGATPVSAREAENTLQRKLGATSASPRVVTGEDIVSEEIQTLPSPLPPRQSRQANPGAFPVEGINSSSQLDLSDSEGAPNARARPGQADEESPPIPQNSNSNFSVNADGLVEAHEIADDSHRNAEREDLAQAHEVDQEAKARTAKINNQRRSRITHFLVYLLGFASGSLVIGLALGLKSSSQDENIIPTTMPSSAPSAAPTSVLDTLMDDLPEETISRILDNPLSPQGLAYDWTILHPNITIFPTWRKVQLFALATFYYAMEGPNWNRVSDYWLRYDLEECFWFSVLFGSFVEWNEGGVGFTTEGVDYAAGDPYLFFRDRQCTEDGRIKSIVLSGLKLANYSTYVPPEVALLTSLTSIKLDANSAGHEGPGHFLPTEIALLPDLKTLGMWGNRINGAMPSELGLLTKLTYLDFDENRLSGSFPSELCSLPELKEVWMSYNKVSGALPSEVGLLKKMELFDLGMNALSGTLPSAIAQMESLRWIALRGNSMTGTLPIQLTDLSTLEGLVLYGNQFTGTIPSEIGKWNSSRVIGDGVEALLLGDNQWSGTIPSQIGLFNKMTQLSLANTYVTGPIPTQVGLLPNLRFLDISNTRISGVLPSNELNNLSSAFDLRGLNISANPDLTGTLPEDICALNSNSSCTFKRSQSLGFHTRITVPCHLDFDCSEYLSGCGCLSDGMNTTTAMDTNASFF